MQEITEYPSQLEKLLHAQEPDARHIRRVYVVSESENTVTYRVVYKEVVMGVSGDDQTDFTIAKQATHDKGESAVTPRWENGGGLKKNQMLVSFLLR